MGNFGHLFGVFRIDYEHIAPETMAQGAENQRINAKGCGGIGAERAETGGCDSKKFFFDKIHKVGLRGWGRSRRNRVAGGDWSRLDVYC